jgi:hypothetical protein
VRATFDVVHLHRIGDCKGRLIVSETGITFDVDNVFETSGNRTRRLFLPNRAAPEDVIDEVRERNRHRSFGLTLKQSFGGSSGTGVAKAD